MAYTEDERPDVYPHSDPRYRYPLAPQRSVSGGFEGLFGGYSSGAAEQDFTAERPFDTVSASRMAGVEQLRSHLGSSG
jgi:hypothetical protein